MSKIVDNLLYPLKEGGAVPSPAEVFQGTSLAERCLRGVREHLEAKGDGEFMVNADLVLRGLSKGPLGPSVRRFSEIEPVSRALGRAFHQLLGIHGPDHIVQLFLPNCADYHLVMLAAWLCRATASLSDPGVSGRVMASQLASGRPRFVVCTRDNLARVLEARERAGLSEEDTAVAVMGEGGERVEGGVLSLDALMAQGMALDAAKGPHSTQNFRVDDRVKICWSSGTTGDPKGVMYSSVHVFTCFVKKNEVPPGNWLVSTSLCHRSGFLGIIRMVQGATTFFFDTRDLQGPGFHKLLTAVSVFKPNVYLAGPHHVLRLIALDPSDYPSSLLDLSSVHFLAPAGSNIPEDSLPAVKRHFKSLAFIGNGYGMSELGSTVASSPSQSSLGGVGAGVVVKIAQPGTEEPLGPDTVGEIMVKDSFPMLGYLNNPELTAKFYGRDGFCHTGDFGHYDREGVLYYDGRMKDLIKVKGQHVYPVELEETLMKLEGVEDAAVFSLPDKDYWELIHAAVVVKPEFREALTADQITAFVNERVDDFQKVRGGVVFVPRIPRSGHMGKMLRAELIKVIKEQGEVKGC